MSNINQNTKKQYKKTLNKIITITLVVFFIATLTSSAYFLFMRQQNKPVNIFGYSIYYVLTDSMESTLDVGDVILVKNTSEHNVKVNDIITFKSTQGVLAGQYITHRVVKINENINNTKTFSTKGDNANEIDTELVTPEKLQGVFVRKMVVIKLLVSMFSNVWLFLLLVILPLFVLFIMQVLDFILKLKKSNNSN